MADQYRITYDNHNKVNGDSFVVHLPQKSVTFRRLTNKLRQKLGLGALVLLGENRNCVLKYKLDLQSYRS